MFSKCLNQHTFQQNVNWKHPERPVIKSWAIEARNYNTTIMGYVYLGMMVIVLGGSALMYAAPFEKGGTWLQWPSFLMALIFFIPMYWLITSYTQAEKLFVYRFTEQGFEVASWKNNTERLKNIFIGVMVACTVVLLVVVVFIPQAFFLIFIGPVGMVLISLGMMSSKDYWERQREFSQTKFCWSELESLLFFKRRYIICFSFDKKKKKKQTGSLYMGNFFIFCPKQYYDELMLFFKNELPHLTSSVGEFDIDCADFE